MTSDPPLRLLLDEHYPGWLAEELREDELDVVSLTHDRPELRGIDDVGVLRTAVAEGRVVVTEDVTTFAAAIGAVPHHHGVIYCLATRFPRTRSGLAHLRRSLVAMASEPPPGLGSQPVVWWLDAADGA